MNLPEMFRVLLRRWYVTFPALVLVVAATAAAWIVWPTKYTSEVQITLLSSRSVASQQGDGGNPYMAFSAGLVSVVDILGRNLSSDQSAQQLKALGFTDSYTAGIALNAQGPFLAIDVTGKNPAQIMKSMPIIVAFTKSKLASMQNASEAPRNSLIQAVPIAPPSQPAPVRKTKIELVAGVAVIGLVGSFLLCFVVDNILERRAGRRAEKYWEDDARIGDGLRRRGTVAPRGRHDRDWEAARNR
jgi:hypothetical protein